MFKTTTPMKGEWGFARYTYAEFSTSKKSDKFKKGKKKQFFKTLFSFNPLIGICVFFIKLCI
jgi:hypothetical protein